MKAFSETQRFRQWWLWLILAASTIVVVGPLFATNGWDKPSNWSGVAIMALVIWLFVAWRLDTRIDTVGIHYRVWPILSWRTIHWHGVQRAYIRQYGFVGYGIRWDFKTWYYNTMGNKGLQIIQKNGNQILIGTQRPDELRQFLDQLHAPAIDQ